MFAEPAVSTEVAAAAASPAESAAFKVFALLAEGDGLPVDEEQRQRRPTEPRSGWGQPMPSPERRRRAERRTG